MVIMETRSKGERDLEGKGGMKNVEGVTGRRGRGLEQTGLQPLAEKSSRCWRKFSELLKDFTSVASAGWSLSRHV